MRSKFHYNNMTIQVSGDCSEAVKYLLLWYELLQWNTVNVYLQLMCHHSLMVQVSKVFYALTHEAFWKSSTTGLEQLKHLSYLSDFIPPLYSLEIWRFPSVIPERWFGQTLSELVISVALRARGCGSDGRVPALLYSGFALLVRSWRFLRWAAGGIAARHGWLPAHTELAVWLGFERGAALALLTLRELGHRAALCGRRRVRVCAFGLGKEKALETNGVWEEKQSPEAQRDQTGEKK